MRLAAISLAAAAGLVGHAQAATYSDLEAGYNPQAFQSADDDWRRITANRIEECGRFGGDNLRRIDVLVDRYLAIGEAIDNSDEQAAVEAAKSLSKAIEANARFEKCWYEIARKEKIGRKFARTIADL